MAIQLSDNLKINVGAPIDSKYLNDFNAPYANVLEVNTTIPIAQRYVGLTVNILNSEYWYGNGVADGDLIIKGTGGGSGSGERIERVTDQLAHGFTVGEVVTYSSGMFIKGIANGSQGGEVIGFVSEVNSVDQFVVVYAGYVEGIGSLGLTPSTTYYLSTTVSGGTQSNKPTTFGDISKPILVTFDANSALIYQYRGFVVTSAATSGGATSGITDIVNIGSGSGEIYSTSLSTISGETAQLRTLIGSGNTNVSTSGDTVIITSSGATGIYNSASPSNITVGGVPVGTSLTGRTLEDIMEEMLVTTFTPTYVNPNNTFIFDPAVPTLQEVGITAGTINFRSTFDQGLIIPLYDSSGNTSGNGTRSGLPTSYTYTGTDLNIISVSTSTTDVQGITDYEILFGTAPNTWTSIASYSEGQIPFDSSGTALSGDTLSSGTTTPADTLSINGIYPWFYGTFASGGAVSGANRPLPNQALIDSGIKVLANSNGTVVVSNFNATGDDYVWFAIPSISTSKTRWYASVFSSGDIAGAVSAGGELFPDPSADSATNISINSPSGLWSGINYDIYIANKLQAATYMEFRNS